MKKKDYYEILGVDKKATTEEIKKAYKKKAIKDHPDRNPGDTAAEERFKEAAEAWDVLGNPEKRAKYDQYGHSGLGGGDYGSGAGMSMDDIFSSFGDIFGGRFDFGDMFTVDGFSSWFGGGNSRSTRQEPKKHRGSDLRIRLRVTLQDVSEGVEKIIKIKRQKPCPHCNGNGTKSGKEASVCSKCNGSGVVVNVQKSNVGVIQSRSACPKCSGTGKEITDKCPHCNGTSLVTIEETITINIPAGVSSGMQLQMSGQGNHGKYNGIPGDLLIQIEEIPDKNFTRYDRNLIHETSIDVITAILGGKIEVPTLSGTQTITIDPGTQPGKSIRLNGKGLPAYGNTKRGDIIISINVYIPEKTDESEKEILNSLREHENFTPPERK